MGVDGAPAPRDTRVVFRARSAAVLSARDAYRTPPMPEKSASARSPDTSRPLAQHHRRTDHRRHRDANRSRPPGARQPADIDRNRWPASIGIWWQTSFGMPSRLHRNPQAHRLESVRSGVHDQGVGHQRGALVGSLSPAPKQPTHRCLTQGVHSTMNFRNFRKHYANFHCRT